ncbi:hypothetical protein PVAND_001927 [Polypedilum vanderplanki]|uniref:Uncharacterized protein n=1 Tax=Polypedilum vanderplanki TaxID=319348 RepID=A0A9J6BQP0_POLVA|nr:hypothetical protein PVAND_001927 [Polypedilum vanderplanki]
MNSNVINKNKSQSIPKLSSSSLSQQQQQYFIVCRKRIKDIKHLQDKQFEHEIKNLEAMQQCAYDQMRFHRIFAITTLWPPLHTRKEIMWTIRKMQIEAETNQNRINFIMRN